MPGGVGRRESVVRGQILAGSGVRSVPVTAVIGLALGALVRKTAVGVSAFAGLFFVAPIIVAQLPHSDAHRAVSALQRRRDLWGQPLATHPLGPWAGFAVLCGYAVVLTGLAAWRLRRRDA
jgi:ABC-2 type transport system permease protein